MPGVRDAMSCLKSSDRSSALIAYVIPIEEVKDERIARRMRPHRKERLAPRSRPSPSSRFVNFVSAGKRI